MAPFAPFLSEYSFQELKKFGESPEESVHLCQYPEEDQRFSDQMLEKSMERIQQIILLGRQKRNALNIKVKIPLSRLTVIHKDSDLLKGISELEDYVKTELNIKAIDYSSEEESYISLYAKPNSPVLGKKLGKEFGKYAGKIKNLSSEQLMDLEQSGNIQIEGKEFSSEEILVFREAKPGTETVSNSSISIDIDPTLNEELIKEGLAREIINRIQKTRKDLDFNVDDRIKIKIQGDEDIINAAKGFKEHISNETLCSEFNESSEPQEISFTIDDKNLSITVTKV